MEQQLIELHFAQLEKAWKKIKTNSFHDKRLQEHVAFLDQLYFRIKNDIKIGIDSSEIEVYKQFINFAFINIEFIDSSSLNLIPYEIIKCLESVLKEWLPDFEKYIIVTALRQSIDSYSIDLATHESLYVAIHEKFEISFPCRLIQLNIPKFLSRDYLANVVLYHEIGHFIDSKYKISEAISLEILKSEDFKDFTELLPALDFFGRANLDDIKKVLKSHIMEYFADIFAAQYIGDTSGHYLNYIAKDHLFSGTHPSTEIRFNVVNDFINKSDNVLIDKFQEAINIIADNEFKSRYSRLSPDDFIHLIPVEVSTESELHSLFVLGWQIWLAQRADIHEANNISNPLEINKIYLILNSLIEKSIGNFIVKENWNKAKALNDSQ